MSWGFNFVAKSKEAAKRQIQKYSIDSNGHFPQHCADAIKSHVDMLPDTPNAISVVSTGHVDENYGNAETKVTFGVIVE